MIEQENRYEIAGGVTIDSGVFVGSNAVCRENINVGRNAIIGFNAGVMGDISANFIFR